MAWHGPPGLAHPSFAVRWLSDPGEADFCLHSCRFAPFVRRCLRRCGWTAAQIIQYKIVDDDSALVALRDAVERWMLNGCPPSQGKTLSLCRSAALYRLFPPVHTGARLGGHAWWTFIAITSLAHFVWRCGLQSFRVQFRGALRCFPAALQTKITWLRTPVDLHKSCQTKQEKQGFP